MTSPEKNSFPKGILEAQVEATRIRKKYVDALRYGKLSFHEFITLIDDPELKTLGKLKVCNILGSFAGWNRVTARHALISNGVPVELSVRQCRNNEGYLAVCTMLMNASASRWQQRLKAPEGWPWFGNVFDALTELDAEKLPRDLREYRYKVEGWKEGSTEEEVKKRWDDQRQDWESKTIRDEAGRYLPNTAGAYPGQVGIQSPVEEEDATPEETGEELPEDTPDQVVVNSIDDPTDEDLGDDDLDDLFSEDDVPDDDDDEEEFDLEAYLSR